MERARETAPFLLPVKPRSLPADNPPVTEPTRNFGMLRTVAPSAADAAPERELLVRHVRKDGQHVVTLRCVQRGGQWHVEADVYPLNTMRVEPLRTGPYAFASSDDAERFVDEAALAFEYLGCELS